MIFPIEPRNIKGRETLAYWENFFSVEQINEILALPQWHNTKIAQVGMPGVGEIKEEIRRTNVGWMDVNQQTLPYWQILSNTIAEVNRTFFHFDLTGCYEPAQLGIYTAENNSHYNWHTDANMGDCLVPRKLSMTLLLSDPSEFEGGELQVKVDNDEIKTLEMVKGRAWFFPSWVLHRVTPVTKGVRRSLVLWIGGPAFK